MAESMATMAGHRGLATINDINRQNLKLFDLSGLDEDPEREENSQSEAATSETADTARLVPNGTRAGEDDEDEREKLRRSLVENICRGPKGKLFKPTYYGQPLAAMPKGNMEVVDVTVESMDYEETQCDLRLNSIKEQYYRHDQKSKIRLLLESCSYVGIYVLIGALSALAALCIQLALNG